ncbi:Alpha-lytic protease precursor [Corynebacterium aquatimens]|nr:Alpha-lytic protease precursor [Corynebacterium aquatimens]
MAFEEPPRNTGVALTLWIAFLMVLGFTIASVAWIAMSNEDWTTMRSQERQENSAARRPPEGIPAEERPEVPKVRVPEMAMWAPGTLIASTDHYPQPGEHFTAQTCTVAFSFSSAAGKNYAVTAGHCGDEGDLVWPTSASTAADYKREAGKFIYSGLSSPGAENIDVGIIEITDPDRYMPLVGDVIPTGLYTGDMKKGNKICKTGGTTGYTCGTFEASDRAQIIRTDGDEERETNGDLGKVCALPGDSGGPVFYEVSGRAAIIGVVSGTEAGRAKEPCDAPDSKDKTMSYSSYEQVTQVIDKVVPDALWIDQAW